MTLRAFEASANQARRLKGERCIRASLGYADALLLDFGALRLAHPSGVELPAIGLVAECPWRLDSQTNVIVGYGDPAEIGAARLQECIGKSVTGVTIYKPSYMLRLKLEGDLVIWVFPDDSRRFSNDTDFNRSSWYIAGYTVDSE
jgi:hypothetical protein